MVQEPDLSPPSAGFEVVRRGYDQGQVDTHLRRMDAEIQILATDRDAALDQSAQLARELDEARARAERLRVQVRSLVSPPQSVQGMSERMRSMLRLAEDEAGEMLAQATLEADQYRRDADVHAAQLVTAAEEQIAALRASSQADAQRALEEVTRVRAEMQDELKAGQEQLAVDRAAATAQLVAAREQAEKQRVASWTESERRRKEIEEDFTIAMNRRRSEALAQLTAERDRLERQVETIRSTTEARARAELERARAAARAELEQAQLTAQAITADANRRVHELVQIRRRILEQLGGTRAALDESLATLDPLPEEQVEPAPSAEPVPDEATTVARPRPTPSPSPPAQAPAAAPSAAAPAASNGSPEPHPGTPRPTARGRDHRPRPERVAVGRPTPGAG
jgi:cell division septum initiation protein DivIVA